MDKNKVLVRAAKILMISFLFFTILAALPRKEEKKEEWKRILEELFWNVVEQKTLSGHFILLEFLQKKETDFYFSSAEQVTESTFPFRTGMSILIPQKETMDGMKEENRWIMEEEKGVEEEIFLTDQGNFLPVKEKQQEINWEKLKTMEALIQEFYTVDPTTEPAEELFLPEELRTMDLRIEKGGEGPQILIYHTHSQEAFADSEEGKREDTIVGAGELLASILEDYGYRVLHHTGEYDVESRDYAYSESLPAITRILEENPGIQVVIDLHRDAVAEGTKLVTTLQERQTAKVMFFNGLSRTKEQGEISYLENPYLKENLAFSLQMKAACDEYYPGFARNIYLRAYRYNMHLAPKTLLVELGAQTNTVEEIKNALYPLAHVLDIVLFGT